MRKDDVINEYFNWLYEIVSDGRYAKSISYRKLLMYLNSVDFRWVIEKDKNRAADGVDLRYRFELACDRMPIDEYLDGPCSVLEMMIGLAIRCEETIMDDPKIGNRTNQWFWGMITNLGLGGMTDNRFDKKFVMDTVDKFLDRRYRPNGRGGLFTVRNCEKDLRDVEIWTIMCWYLDSIS